ncbi:MAG: hypothetical protein LIP12_08565 [Clostridiales bacterium]|nr:hypothetical protein [Clostridiales bacterium]
MSGIRENPEALLPVVRDLNTAIFIAADSSDRKPVGMGASGAGTSETGPFGAGAHGTGSSGMGASGAGTPETGPSGAGSTRADSRGAPLSLAERAERTITYDIRWHTERSGRRGFGRRPAASDRLYAELIISCPARVTPQLKLVYRKDGHVPMSEANPGLVVLHTIDPFPEGFPDGRYICSFEADTFRGLKPGTHLRLMLSREDVGAYFMRIRQLENLRVPEA